MKYMAIQPFDIGNYCEEDHEKEVKYYTFDENDWPLLLDNKRLHNGHNRL
jgi:hypothetical protein